MREYKVKLDASKFKITDQGFLQCQANLTRTGVFKYLDPDTGKTVRELRCDEEVFSAKSMESLKLAPITHEHPSDLLSSTSTTPAQVGSVGENIRKDGQFLTGTVQLVSEDVVKGVLEKRGVGIKAELSCGYKAREDKTPGVHPEFGKYDLIQRDIIYNHVSLVPAGRAGPDVCLKLDNKEKGEVSMLKFKKDGVKTPRFTMDSIEAEVPDEAFAVLERLSHKLDEAIVAIEAAGTESEGKQSRLDALQGKHDALVADHKKISGENTDLKDPSSPVVAAMVADRAKLDGACKHFNIETEGRATLDCKKDIIKASAPECDLDGKSGDYIDARFDAALESLGDKLENVKKVMDSRSPSGSKSEGNENLSPRDRFIRDSKKKEV